jgi:hypothetical protein
MLGGIAGSPHNDAPLALGVPGVSISKLADITGGRWARSPSLAHVWISAKNLNRQDFKALKVLILCFLAS